MRGLWGKRGYWGGKIKHDRDTVESYYKAGEEEKKSKDQKEIGQKRV